VTRGAAWLSVVSAVVVSILPSVPASANNAQLTTLKRLSGKSPFHGCGVPGDEQRGSEAEPHLAVDPRNPRRLVATWQQDRFVEDGGALSNLVASSRDGGRTWRTVRLPGLSRCTRGKDERASDPWLSIGRDGTVYQSSLTFTVVPALTGLAGPTALRVSRSRDGGRTFSRPTTVVDAGLYDDREAVTADPLRRGNAYVVWVRRLGRLGEFGSEYFSRTTDGGRSFSAPRSITALQPGTPSLVDARLPDPTLLEVLPDGTLLNVYLEANPSPFLGLAPTPWVMWAQRSRDRGRSWSEPVRIADIDTPGAPHDPDSGAEVRAFNVIGTAVAEDGTAYVVWNEIGSARSARILISRSRDAGRTWSRPGTVARLGSQAFLPNVAVMPDGTVGVTFDDFRNDRPGDGRLSTDVWFRHSHDGGRSWRERHLAGPFDMLTASRTSSTAIAGRFVGDYQGLVALPGGFGAVFAQARPAARVGPSDVFYARVALRPATLRLSVTPRRAQAGRRTRFRLRATARVAGARSGVRGAIVRLGGRRAGTDRRGRASLEVTLRRPGVHRARASRRGFTSGRVRVLASGTLSCAASIAIRSSC
jgi:hypothetical protein